MLESDLVRLKPTGIIEQIHPEFGPELSDQMNLHFKNVDLSKTFVEQFLAFFINEKFVVHEFLPVKNKESEDGLKAGTFSNLNLDYFHRFLGYVKGQSGNSPFILALNSAGVRLTQTRDMFNRIWGIVPRLFQLRKQRPFFSVADHQCLVIFAAKMDLILGFSSIRWDIQ